MKKGSATNAMKKKSVIKVIIGALFLGMTSHTYAGEIHTGCSANYRYGTPSKLDCGVFSGTCAEMAGARDSGEYKRATIKESHANSINDEECRMVDECANRIWGPWKDKSRSEVDRLADQLCEEHPEL